MHLLISFSIYSIVATAMFSALIAYGIESSTAFQVYPALIALIPLLSQTLKEMKETKQTRSGERALLDFQNYGIHPALMALYATLILISTMTLIVVMGFAQDSPNEELVLDQASQSAFTFLGTIVLLIGYLLFRWIGKQCRGSWKNGAMVSAGLTTFVLLFIYFGNQEAIASDETTKSEAMLAMALCGGVFALAFWRGTKQKLTAYVAYLLRSIAPKTRSVFLDMMREEASSARNAGNQAKG